MFVSPPRLKQGDVVAVIAPARNINIISALNIKRAEDRLKSLGLEVVYGEHVMGENWQRSASVADRLSDLHWAFANDKVRAILTVIGGFNCNELLSGIDWSLIKANPKIFCGFSDITALSMAISHRTGMITYSGPHFSTFSLAGDELEYVKDYFIKCMFHERPFTVSIADQWRSDAWYLHPDPPQLLLNDPSPWLLRGNGDHSIEGTIWMAGNLAVISLLQGTPHLKAAVDHLKPEVRADLKAIVMLEWCAEARDGLDLACFTQRLVSLLQFLPRIPDAIIIGRMELASGITRVDLERLAVHLETIFDLGDCVISANWDFGHTVPIFPIPVGGIARLHHQQLTFIQH